MKIHFLLVFFLSGFIFISEAKAINLEFFQFSQNTGYSQTHHALKTRSLYPSNYPWILTSSLSYVSNPLTVKQDNERVSSVIDSLSTLQLGGAYRYNENTQFGLASMMSYQYGNNLEGYFPGDTQVDMIWKFFENTNHALAFHPKITLPTGTGDYVTNSPKASAYLGWNLESRFQAFQTAVNLGYLNSPGSKLTQDVDATSEYTIDLREALRIGFGAYLPMTGPWALNIEAYRYQQIQGDQHPNEIYAGLKHRTSQNLLTFGGLSAGGLIDKSSNDYRISFGLKYAPVAEDAPVVELKKQEEKLTRQELLRRESEIYGRMFYAWNVYFANNSTVIVETFKKQLRKLKKKYSPGYHFILEGFASKRGNAEHNFILSEERTREVSAFLVGLGISKDKIKTVAYGDARAIEDIDEALNRKVMIRIYRK